MDKFIVKGGKSLNGTFVPTGNKNEALPVLAASLLSTGEVCVENVPNILDVLSMKEIIESFGISITKTSENGFKFDNSQFIDGQIDQTIFSKIRGSFLMVVPLLNKLKKIVVPPPGGDKIGRRRLDTHLLALNQFGVDISVIGNEYHFQLDKWKAANIFLDEASVMATETALMAASLIDEESTIYNAACEPHVQGLCRLLQGMGVIIEGVGTNFLKITGPKILSGTTHKIAPDHTEIGSIIGLAAVTNSEITIEGGGEANMGLIPHFFEKLGVRYEIKKNNIFISAKQELKILGDTNFSIPKIDDSPWPGFPADLISIVIIIASQCEGTLLVFEKLFESRLFWVDKLISMGAEIILCDPHRAIVRGPSKLHAQVVNSPDIRAGMALLIASLCAEGTSEIFNIHQIDRGYQSIDKRLNELGADIQRV